MKTTHHNAALGAGTGPSSCTRPSLFWGWRLFSSPMVSAVQAQRAVTQIATLTSCLTAALWADMSALYRRLPEGNRLASHLIVALQVCVRVCVVCVVYLLLRVHVCVWGGNNLSPQLPMPYATPMVKRPGVTLVAPSTHPQAANVVPAAFMLKGPHLRLMRLEWAIWLILGAGFVM
jgi:hypothetical protein